MLSITFDLYFIMLSVKQRDIKYHFLSLWYDSTGLLVLFTNPSARGRIIGFIPFPRVLVLCEMQWVSSRIWTRIAVFVSYDDNNYTTGTSYWTISEHSTTVPMGWSNITYIIFTQPLRSGRIWHKVNFF